MNPQAYVDSLWDWGFLNDCFGNTGIRVSDIDGMVERNGWCLMFETKGPGVPVPVGQALMFRELVKKGFAVITIWGRPNKPEQMQIWYPHQLSAKPIQPASIEDVKDIVRRWFNWADANGDIAA